MALRFPHLKPLYIHKNVTAVLDFPKVLCSFFSRLNSRDGDRLVGKSTAVYANCLN